MTAILSASAMQAFCSEGEDYGTGSLFMHGPYCCATNGRVAVMQRDVPEGYEHLEKRRPDIGQIITSLESETVWRPVWERPVPSSMKIRNLCHGAGKAECDFGHMHPCHACGSKGTIEPTIAVKALGSVVDNKYLRLLTNSLPGLEVGPVQEHSIIPLRWTGGFAAVMPMLGPGAVHCEGVAP